MISGMAKPIAPLTKPANSVTAMAAQKAHGPIVEMISTSAPTCCLAHLWHPWREMQRRKGFAMWRVCIVALGTPLMAEPALPTFQPPITVLQHGIFCDTDNGARIAAPETQLGYIELAPEGLEISRVQQTLPADIGLAFGVFAQASRDVAVTVKVHRPDLAAPETWDSFIRADALGPAYFTFDFPQEQVPGLWAIEAWEGDQRLYRVEYLVTPAGSDPKLTGFCQLLS